MSKLKRKPTPVARESADLREGNIARLRELFPEAVTEGKIDFAKLRETLGDDVDDRPERYSFTWAGKRDAIRLLQTPSRATLVPCPEESVNFETTNNVFIEGENLEVLKLLYKSYAGRVKMIYIDPPYNTGNDFIYPDNFTDPLDTYLKLTGQKDSEGNLLTSNPETSGRYHSAWLTMMYPRLFVARQMLREDGFIVVSIDDAELTNLRASMNEVFGEENFIAILVWDRNRKNDATFFSVGHEYMVVYARNRQFLKNSDVILRALKEGIEEVREEFAELCKKHGNDWGSVRKGMRLFFDNMTGDDPRKALARFGKVDSKGPFRDDGNPSWPGGGGPRYAVLHPRTGKPCKIPSRGWLWPTKERFDEELAAGHIVFGPDEKTVPSVRSYLFEKTTEVMRSVSFSYAQTAAQEFDSLFDGGRVFDNPKHYADLSRMVEYLTGKDDLVVDFFAGSGSLAHAVLHSNHTEKSWRRFVCVQLPEPVNAETHTGENAKRLGLNTIAEIGKERIRRVIKRLQDESKGKLDLKDREVPEDLGFKVFKLTESNYQCWRGAGAKTGEALLAEMEKQVDPLLPGWKPMNVLCEVALKEGYSLTCRVEELIGLTGNTAYRVSDADKGQCFLICLDDKLKAATVKALGLKKDDLFICRDVALTDEQAANLALQCNVKTI
ncbi:MAG: site-specific DNA-methyltransferase [Planctomycetota bacterium]|nr:site-specific DNA-methyltransferase [Planctomycetota bacterium]